MRKILGISILFSGFLCLVGMTFDIEKKEKDNRKNITRDSFIEEATVATFPTVMIREKGVSTPLRMDYLKVDVEVVHGVSVTTLDMTFVNETIRVLEGELYFPLGEGQTVSRFAMEVNGRLREGVIVEKEKGRVAFESTVRKEVDPGLLEWVAGNNFRSRVYPIPSKGTKRIVVSYESRLKEIKGEFFYHLPLNFPNKLSALDLDIRSLKQEVTPSWNQNIATVKFEKWQENYRATAHLEEFVSNQSLSFFIPKPEGDHRVLISEANQSGEHFFQLSPKIADDFREKRNVENLDLIWDVSFSKEMSDKSKEIKLVEEYCKSLSNLHISFMTFSNVVQEKKSFQIINGDTRELVKHLNGLKYDGATNLSCIHFDKLKGEETILVSDGLNNYGKFDLTTFNRPIMVLNAALSADHLLLKKISKDSNGQYINLNRLSIEEAKQILKKEQLSIVSITASNNEALRDIYVDEQAHIVGKVMNSTDVIVRLGFGKTVEYELRIPMNLGNGLIKTELIERLWAQKKLEQLLIREEENNIEILELARKYTLVTPQTSLIILDNVEDYVEHKITPPDELLKGYNKLIGNNNSKTEKERIDKMAKVIKLYEERCNWYDKKFVIREQKASETQIRWNSVSSRLAFDSDEEILENVNDGSVGYSIHEWNEESNGFYAESKDKGIIKSGSNSKINIKTWNPETPYLEEIKKAENSEEKYYQLRSTYKNQPSYFLDVADYFQGKRKPKIALRILSNIAELQLENAAMLRVLAHRLEQLKEFDLAVAIYKKVLKIKGEEPQSYRDLGLAYALNGEDQLAIELLYEVVGKTWDGRFPEIETIIVGEMNKIIAKSTQGLDLSFIDESLLKHLPVDVRIVLTWDTDNCDMDLWVTGPRGEKCMYSHSKTESGGRLSKDFTGGYGPEEFLIKKALAGNYKIEVDYFGTSSQKLTGPTTIQVKMISNYGRKNEKIEEVTRRLGTAKEVLEIGSISYL